MMWRATGGWRWTEPSVWTERMLTALEKGVKGGKWFSSVINSYSFINPSCETIA